MTDSATDPEPDDPQPGDPEPAGTEPTGAGGVSDKTASLDRLEDELGVLLRRIRWVLTARARTTHPDISSPAYLLLGKLAAQGPRRSSDLAEEFGIDKGAVSRQVQQLGELGLVERTADPEDGRAQLIAISADGRRRLGVTHAQRRQLLEGRLEDWTGPELDDFVAALARYNSSLDGANPGASPGVG